MVHQAQHFTDITLLSFKQFREAVSELQAMPGFWLQKQAMLPARQGLMEVVLSWYYLAIQFGTCLVRVSVAVIKQQDQKQLGEETPFIWMTNPGFQFIEESQDRN